ncbi:MAG: molybdenum cofactor guanylyltransferase [Thermoleophilaceae bacterium]
MASSHATIGVVLAGGASTRMGAPKAGLPLGDGTLIERPLAALAAAGLEAVVVAKADSPLPPLEVPRWDEPDSPRHPLCGIVAALERAGAPIVVLACDMPHVPPALVERLARTPADAALPVVGGMSQPLVARYAPAALEPLAAALAAERPLRAAVAALGPATIDEVELRRYGDPARMFANVNRPEDLDALGRLERPG